MMKDINIKENSIIEIIAFYNNSNKSYWLDHYELYFHLTIDSVNEGSPYYTNLFISDDDLRDYIRVNGLTDGRNNYTVIGSFADIHSLISGAYYC